LANHHDVLIAGLAQRTGTRLRLTEPAAAGNALGRERASDR